MEDGAAMFNENGVLRFQALIHSPPAHGGVIDRIAAAEGGLHL
jgi:hypothetical protein